VRRRADRGRLYAIVGVVVVAAVVVGAGYTTSWYGLAKPSAASATACPKGVTLSGAGASFLSALMDQWETSYTSASGNKINYNPSGAGAGITSFSGKQVDFAATDEPVSPSDESGFPGTTLTLPVTGGAVAIVYNLPGWSGTLDLNASTIAGIYSGAITNWDSASLTAGGANTGLPDQTIIPVVRSDAAGTSYVLTNYLSDDNTSWASSVGTSISPTWPSGVAAEKPAKGNSGLATYVNETAYAIGYVDLADAKSHSNLGLAAVENPKDAYVVPTVADTQSAINDLSGQSIPAATGDWSAVSWVNAPGAGDFPLATLSYFLVLQDPALGYEPSAANTSVLVQWLTWVIQDGQTYAAGLYYVVPPTSVLTQDLSALSSVNYNGASLPTCS
jgi:phosphate transport system substrate-binding protein